MNNNITNLKNGIIIPHTHSTLPFGCGGDNNFNSLSEFGNLHSILIGP